MMFRVALYLPWCRYLEARRGVSPISMLIISKVCVCVCVEILVCFCALRGSLLGGWSAKKQAPTKCVLLSTSKAVRGDMRNWVSSEKGDNWTVKMNVRDLGRQLDTTRRGWFSTLSARVRLAISRPAFTFVLPLDFHGRVRVVGTMFISFFHTCLR